MDPINNSNHGSKKISHKKILFLSANPKSTARLRLDEEFSEIEKGLERSKFRDRFEIHPKFALKLRDIRRALLEIEPQIVHFSGHGNEKGIYIEDEIGYPQLISTKALMELFKLCSSHVECVILNACDSLSQAKAMQKHIQYVIGMKQEIKDKAAIEFIVGFYDALGAGKSIEEAFEFGRNGILLLYPDMQHHFIPVLKKKPVPCA